MKILDNFVGKPRDCSYLPGRDASLEYRVMVDVEAEEWEQLLLRGWRRFGVAYFRPRCGPCSECVPLRIPTSSFTPSRSQRRVLRKGRRFRAEMHYPIIDHARLDLYRAWHDKQGGARGWSAEPMTAERYFHEFALPHVSAREVAYYDELEDDRLAAVALVDETPNALSAVYTYHHPDYASLSLGTLSILRQIDMARQMGKAWLFLGYRILGCVSSEYKRRFYPHELLEGWPEEQDSPVWTRVER